MKLKTVSVALFLFCLVSVMAEEVDFSVPEPAVRNWNAALAVPVSSATKTVSAAPEGPVLWADSSTSFGDYADEGGGASIEFDTSSGERVIHVNTGTGWGCGIFSRSQQPVYPDGCANVGDATRIVLRLKSSKPFQFRCKLDESGANVPDAGSFQGSGSADGEQFMSELEEGKEGLHDYEILLSDLSPSTDYGNPDGNRTIDTDAISAFGLLFIGNTGEFDLEIESIRFE